jgi:hypothetical protein
VECGHATRDSSQLLQPATPNLYSPLSFPPAKEIIQSSSFKAYYLTMLSLIDERERRWNDPDWAKPNYLENSSPDVTLSTTNSTRSGKVILSVIEPCRRIGGVEI